MKKLLIAIAILSCAALVGCANSAESAVSAESSASTTSATTAQSTTATSVTTSATTSATSATTTPAATTTAETTASEAVEEIPEAAPELPTDPIADQIVQEREDSIPIATDEQVAQIEQDRKDRQDLADDTSAYTTDGIPLTTNGDLTEPAKPTDNYKLPDGAQLEFTGDPDTAIYTELPDGCYWVGNGSNAFIDPAGNTWINRNPESIEYALRCRDNGYYSPDGDYHPSQYEIDESNRRTEASREIWENGPTDPSDIKISDEGRQTLDDLLGI